MGKKTIAAIVAAAIFAFGYHVGNEGYIKHERETPAEVRNNKLRTLQDLVTDDAARWSDDYAYRSVAEYNDGRNDTVFGEGKYKCNLYVHNMLKEAGLPAPRKPNRSSDGVRWPLQAYDWANKDLDIPHWEVVANGQLRGGDVIAHKNISRGATGHVGIVVETPDGFGVVSARKHGVMLNQYCTRNGKAKSGRTVRRYSY